MTVGRISGVLLATAVAAGAVLTGGCALTHHEQAPAMQELALRYPPPEPQEAAPLDAALKVRRFSALAPFQGTEMRFARGGYRMDAFNYEHWVTSPPEQVTDLLYRDLAASHALRAVFPPLSTEAARFQLEGTVIEMLATEHDGTWRGSLIVDISLVDTAAQRSDQRVVLQRRFEAAKPLGGDSAEQYAAGMSAATKDLSRQVRAAVVEACRTRLNER